MLLFDLLFYYTCNYIVTYKPGNDGFISIGCCIRGSSSASSDGDIVFSDIFFQLFCMILIIGYELTWLPLIRVTSLKCSFVNIRWCCINVMCNYIYWISAHKLFIPTAIPFNLLPVWRIFAEDFKTILFALLVFALQGADIKIYAT